MLPRSEKMMKHEKIGDFFNYKEELGSFLNYLTDKNTRMIVVRGLRRTGKSSLLRVGLNKARIRFVMIDVRELTSLSRRSFEYKLLEELRTIKGLPGRIMEKIEGVDAGIRISFKKNDEGIWKLLKTIKPVVVVDEVQMLRGSGVESFFAALYDNTDCKIVLSGSEIGVLEAFIGKDRPDTPLFGRVYKEIKMQQLTAEKSSEFLLAGFSEMNMHIPDKMLELALQELDGIIGWLAMFGNCTLSTEPEKALTDAITKGAVLAYAEFESFLNARLLAKKRYISLIRLLATRAMGWTELKHALQIELKESISDPQFTNYLDALLSYGFIVHVNDVYFIPDPLFKKALTGGISNL
jgi:AAA+ ATPase superfamily predicted ATPase